MISTETFPMNKRTGGPTHLDRCGEMSIHECCVRGDLEALGRYLEARGDIENKDIVPLFPFDIFSLLS
jgi:hypothetical protein